MRRIKVWTEWPDYPAVKRALAGYDLPEELPVRGECVEEGEGAEVICARRLWLNLDEVVLTMVVV